ncbi:uncharacterized protein LOC121726934 [Aricia agestis]|uniref:uncharacterized protein LOC121726934 n=1 Tax=Aricia agestis TaxID=91739 RepID=UPI001C20BE76|nr:uncharacterized protein LOC121726934 [Aricia agestis]
MLIAFLYILIYFTNAYVDSKAVGKTYRQQFEFIDNILRLNDSASQTTAKNVTTPTTPNFKMLLDDLYKKKNLKLNFFDKMLSDEMLSIKKHIQEKGYTLIHLNMSTNIPASTPTLEIKQKWPTLKNVYISINEDEKKTTKYNNATDPSTKTTKIFKTTTANETQNAKVQRRNKVVGVRSFTDHEILHVNTDHDPRKCMCLNERTTCTARCTASTHHHTQVNECSFHKTSSNIPVCTRTTTPYIFYPYVITYVTPYIVVPTEPPREHKRKHKHDRPHTHSPKYDYEENYETTYDEEKNQATGAEYEADDNDYGSESNKGKDKLQTGNLEANREKLVSNIIDDLKVYYNDAVIKDCYCSSWSNIFQTKCFSFYVFVFTVFLM